MSNMLTLARKIKQAIPTCDVKAQDNDVRVTTPDGEVFIIHNWRHFANVLTFGQLRKYDKLPQD